MRLPFINLRFIAISVVAVLAVGGAVAGWLWNIGRPDKLYESAQGYYQQGQKLRGVGDPNAKPTPADLVKAKSAYDNGLTQLNLFLSKAANKDPRLSQA